MHTPPCTDPLRRRAPARKKAHVLACLLTLGAAALLGILSSAQNASDYTGQGTTGLRNALAQGTLTVSDRLLGSEAKHPSPLLPPARRTPDVDALFPRLAGIQVLPENWLLNGAAAQRLGFTADETKALNAHLARMREEFCASETSRMRIREEDGTTVIVIPPHDGNPLRRKLYEGIAAIAGPERTSAAGMIWSYAKDRAETDFAWFGEHSVNLKFTPAVKSGVRTWNIEASEYTGARPQPAISPSWGTASASVASRTEVDSPGIPLRYAHLWKAIP